MVFRPLITHVSFNRFTNLAIMRIPDWKKVKDLFYRPEPPPGTTRGRLMRRPKEDRSHGESLRSQSRRSVSNPYANERALGLQNPF